MSVDGKRPVIRGVGDPPRESFAVLRVVCDGQDTRVLVDCADGTTHELEDVTTVAFEHSLDTPYPPRLRLDALGPKVELKGEAVIGAILIDELPVPAICSICSKPIERGQAFRTHMQSNAKPVYGRIGDPGDRSLRGFSKAAVTTTAWHMACKETPGTSAAVEMMPPSKEAPKKFAEPSMRMRYEEAKVRMKREPTAAELISYIEHQERMSREREGR